MAAFPTNTAKIFLRNSISTPNLVKTYNFCPKFPNNYSNFSNPKSVVPINTATPRVSVAATIAAQEEDSTSTPTTSYIVKEWAEFAEKVSGEWDGFGADFTVEGKPLELPEQVVPEAYREWEVKVFDWQTQCPTLGQLTDDESPSLIYKTIKLLPTVGCEADAATRYSIHEKNVIDSSAFAYQHSSGCYVAVWPVNAELMEVEHCLVDPRDKESRVRIIQVLRGRDCELKLQSVKVFVEQWYGPYRNGDQLGGCAIRDSAFASTPPLEASQVTGVWRGLTSTASLHGSQHVIQQLGGEHVHESSRDEGDLILLPKQLWCSVRRDQNDEIYCEVGWLLDQGRAITSKCTFSSTSELKEISIASETASTME